MYQKMGTKRDRADRLSCDLGLSRVPLPPEAGHRRHVRLDLRSPGRVRLGGRDLESDARGRHRQVSVHRLVPRPPDRRRPEAVSLERSTQLGGRSARRLETVRSSRNSARSRSAAGIASTPSAIRRCSFSSASSQRFPKWLVWQALLSPKLELRGRRASARHVGHCGGSSCGAEQRMAAELRQQARAGTQGRPRRARRDHACQTAPSWRRAETREDIGQLEGKAYKHTGVSFWPDYHVTDDRAKIEWVVRGKRGDARALTARHERAGAVSATECSPERAADGKGVGFGGLFFKSSDPERLLAWYAQWLSIGRRPDVCRVQAGDRCRQTASPSGVRSPPTPTTSRHRRVRSCST